MLQLMRFIIIFGLALMVSSCGPARNPVKSEGHLSSDDIKTAEAPIPETVEHTTLLPEPESRPVLETYTVVVNDVPVKELLFSMARDARLNLDIAPDVTGQVTLNAIDQTLPQILERISNQAEIRYELKDGTLTVSADKPFIRTYKVDYLNMTRNSKGKVSVSTSVGTTGGSAGDSSGGTGQSNDSLTEMNTVSNNTLWSTLTRNISSIIGEENSSQNSSEELLSTDNVIVNRETGIIAVNTTQKKHKLVQQFLDDVLLSARRQVLIEATIAEITLSDRYQSGIDWSLITGDSSSQVSFTSSLTGANLSQSPFNVLTASNNSGNDSLKFTLKALEEFGDVQVLSSPKVMAINNQTAMLKVVDNLVYFEIEVNTTISGTAAVSNTTFETDIKTVPVGFVMSVTPFIDDRDTVTLNVRPTISRVIDSVDDPNPALANADVISSVPVVQVREIESVLKVDSGDTAIIGGLMQDVVNNKTSGIPLLSDIPILGKLFSYEDDTREKSELVIFIRPVVVKHASLTGDLQDYRHYLPETSKTSN